MLGVLVLTLATFAFSTGAYVFAGLLAPMAEDLRVSVSVAGQLQTAFAIACAIGGPALAFATVKIPRKPLLLGVLAALTLLNGASALVDQYWQLAVVRLGAGFVGALTFPISSAIAISLVEERNRPNALAAVLGGNTLAFLIGLPLGSFFGATFGWPASFAFAAFLCGLVGILVLIFVPSAANVQAQAAAQMSQLKQGTVISLLAISLCAFTATFITSGFIGPVITELTGAEGAQIGLYQSLFGLGSIVGLLLGARLAKRDSSVLVGIVGAIGSAQLLYSFGMLVVEAELFRQITTGFAVFGSAVALFSCTPVLQTKLAIEAGAAAPIAFALNGSMIFAGQGIGTILGGVVVEFGDLSYLGLAGFAMAMFGLIPAWWLGKKANSKSLTA